MEKFFLGVPYPLQKLPLDQIRLVKFFIIDSRYRLFFQDKIIIIIVIIIIIIKKKSWWGHKRLIYARESEHN